MRAPGRPASNPGRRRLPGRKGRVVRARIRVLSLACRCFRPLPRSQRLRPHGGGELELEGTDTIYLWTMKFEEEKYTFMLDTLLTTSWSFLHATCMPGNFGPIATSQHGHRHCREYFYFAIFITMVHKLKPIFTRARS